jgi:translation initiation factor IF-3
VEISPNQEPPVVKITDYSKLIFEQRKRVKDSKKKQKVVHLKEIKFRPGIDINDYHHKVKHAITFFEKGDKVKFTVVFKGRQIVHNELGFKVMENIQKDIADCALIEREPIMEGRNIIMIAGPVPASGAKKKKE